MRSYGLGPPRAPAAYPSTDLSFLLLFPCLTRPARMSDPETVAATNDGAGPNCSVDCHSASWRAKKYARFATAFKCAPSSASASAASSFSPSSLMGSPSCGPSIFAEAGLWSSTSGLCSSRMSATGSSVKASDPAEEFSAPFTLARELFFRFEVMGLVGGAPRSPRILLVFQIKISVFSSLTIIEFSFLVERTVEELLSLPLRRHESSPALRRIVVFERLI
mmetsp:Transcript_48679/g.83095  ORF Transcript_48679/g.83095 Transcript_48679/m.83095 type:complete len:221 (-) Transcript_48679:111-773(-)